MDQYHINRMVEEMSHFLNYIGSLISIQLKETGRNSRLYCRLLSMYRYLINPYKHIATLDKCHHQSSNEKKIRHYIIKLNVHILLLIGTSTRTHATQLTNLQQHWIWFNYYVFNRLLCNLWFLWLDHFNYLIVLFVVCICNKLYIVCSGAVMFQLPSYPGN